MRLIKAFAVVLVLGVAALLGSLWIEHRSEITLPPPTGPFAVGRVLFDWSDDHAVDPLAPGAATKRELLVWIWYPAEAGHGAVLDDYVPASVRPPAAPPSGFRVFDLLTRDLSKVHGHSLRNAEVSPRQRSYPVLIMRGGGSAPVMNYSTIAEDLASHGYVVVGFDAPYRTGRVVFPDGRVIGRRPENNPELFRGKDLDRLANKLLAAWTADVGFALDRLQQYDTSDPSGRFTGRLDLSRLGVFGHSFGGATALQFCRDDARCQCGIDIDGAPFGSVIETGVNRPFMFVLCDHTHESDPEAPRILANIQSIYDRLPPGGRVRIAIRGANHFTFSEDGALLKSGIFRAILRAFGKLGIDGRRQLAVTTFCVRTFFDAHLKGSGSDARIASPQYPEIEVLR